VAQEAGAATTIYRLPEGLSAQPGTALRNAMTNYRNAVIARDWPAMGQGVTSGYRATRLALDGAYAALLAYPPSQPRAAVLESEILRQLDSITQARRARLIAAEGLVPSVIWPVLFGGAFIAIHFRPCAGYPRVYTWSCNGASWIAGIKGGNNELSDHLSEATLEG